MSDEYETLTYEQWEKRRSIIMSNDNRTLTYEEWKKEGRAKFGPDTNNWKFRCPMCSHVASVKEYRDADVEDMAGFSCIGRVGDKGRDAFSGEGPGPCNYAGGGLFALNPVTITGPKDGHTTTMFEWAEMEEAPADGPPVELAQEEAPADG